MWRAPRDLPKRHRKPLQTGESLPDDAGRRPIVQDIGCAGSNRFGHNADTFLL
jgi:hypothetical protein